MLQSQLASRVATLKYRDQNIGLGDLVSVSRPRFWTWCQGVQNFGIGIDLKAKILVSAGLETTIADLGLEGLNLFDITVPGATWGV